MVINSNYKIKCPYCTKEFAHTDVLFRARTCFRSEELDPYGEGETLENIQFIMADGPLKDKRIQEYHKRSIFLIGEDEKYSKFWSRFGGTSERRRKENNIANADIVEDFERPLIDPSNPAHVVMNGGDGKSVALDEDGFLSSVVDSFGQSTTDRVCPHCCNPLPDGYGKFPVKFIPMIGITRAGKTVYLSSLFDNMFEYATEFGMTTYPSNGHYAFIEANKIEKGRPLPGSTLPSVLTQPVTYTLEYYLNNRPTTVTIVIYDMAGEIFNPDYSDKNGSNFFEDFKKYIEIADGLIILQPPEQFKDLNDKAAEMVKNVLSRIHATFPSKKYCELPMAMCISKSDMLISENIFDLELTSLLQSPVRAAEGTHNFCAKEYNQISTAIDKFYKDHDKGTRLALKNRYDNYNFFAISSLNCKIDKSGQKDKYGNELEMPMTSPNPLRIEEPLFWLFTQFGIMNSDMPIVKHATASKIESLNNSIDELNNEINRLEKQLFRKKKIEKLQQEIDSKNAEIKKLLNN